MRISAVRALSRIDTAEARKRLWDIASGDGEGFARVLALWGLKRLNAREYLPKLRELVKAAPTDRTGFGGNIMDPRVGTRFPASVQEACQQLLSDWSNDPTTRPTTRP